MVYASTILDSLADAMRDALPSETTYATLELDQDGAHADLKPPVAEIVPRSVIPDTSRNTEHSGYVTDENGNRVGRLYEEWFYMTVQCQFITAQGGGHNPRTLARDARTALSLYDDRKIGRPLPDPESTGTLDDVDSFELGDQEPANDLSTTPALRVEQLLVDTQFSHEISSVDLEGEYDTIKQVLTPDADTDPEQAEAGSVAIDVLTSS